MRNEMESLTTGLNNLSVQQSSQCRPLPIELLYELLTFVPLLPSTRLMLTCKAVGQLRGHKISLEYQTWKNCRDEYMPKLMNLHENVPQLINKLQGTDFCGNKFRFCAMKLESAEQQLGQWIPPQAMEVALARGNRDAAIGHLQLCIFYLRNNKTKWGKSIDDFFIRLQTYRDDDDRRIRDLVKRIKTATLPRSGMVDVDELKMFKHAWWHCSTVIRERFLAEYLEQLNSWNQKVDQIVNRRGNILKQYYFEMDPVANWKEMIPDHIASMEELVKELKKSNNSNWVDAIDRCLKGDNGKNLL